MQSLLKIISLASLPNFPSLFEWQVIIIPNFLKLPMIILLLNAGFPWLIGYYGSELR